MLEQQVPMQEQQVPMQELMQELQEVEMPIEQLPMRTDQSIFVSVSSFRDRYCSRTIANLFRLKKNEFAAAAAAAVVAKTSLPPVVAKTAGGPMHGYSGRPKLGY